MLQKVAPYFKACYPLLMEQKKLEIKYKDRENEFLQLQKLHLHKICLWIQKSYFKKLFSLKHMLLMYTILF